MQSGRVAHALDQLVGSLYNAPQRRMRWSHDSEWPRRWKRRIGRGLPNLNIQDTSLNRRP